MVAYQRIVLQAHYNGCFEKFTLAFLILPDQFYISLLSHFSRKSGNPYV